MNNLAVIIPMAGFGQRFKDAGYDEYKPFIKVKDKYMIDLALEPYPKEIKKYLIVNPKLLSEEQRNYLENIDNVEILEIEGHKNGPSYSIHLVKDMLPKKYSYFISYDPELAHVNFQGEVLIIPDDIKKTVKDWKKKKISDEDRIPVFNYIMSKCNLKALMLEEDLGLPAHIPLPRFGPPEEKGKANYTG